MQLYMIRHGQSHVNLRDWTGGNVDASLTELGQQQAAALGEWLPGEIEKIDVLYCSTMQRARETAAPISTAYNIPIELDDRLREIGNNRLDHTPWPGDDLPEYGEFWGSERPFHSITPTRKGGESLMHFRIRVGAFIEDLIERHQNETVVVVCHGGVIETVYDHLFNIGPWRRCEVWTKNTAVTRFDHVQHPNREVWRLHYHARTEHLIGLRKKKEG
jgi:probable phosphoglycerate mutase